jgi:riboflavin synthase
MIVGRGSITVEGISLTVAREKGNEFTMAIIPYTWENTNLKFKKVGDSVNLEFDVIGKYVVKYLASIGRDSI